MGLVADAEVNAAAECLDPCFERGQTTDIAQQPTRASDVRFSPKADRYQSRFFAKARPECDFKYRSNSRALYLSGKAQYQTNSQGTNFAVWADFPAL
jgi:hypothetical protein